jgi:predicted TIM-barrel fold metal-dependent hydrolase
MSRTFIDETLTPIIIKVRGSLVQATRRLEAGSAGLAREVGLSIEEADRLCQALTAATAQVIVAAGYDTTEAAKHAVTESSKVASGLLDDLARWAEGGAAARRDQAALEQRIAARLRAAADAAVEPSAELTTESVGLAAALVDKIVQAYTRYVRATAAAGLRGAAVVVDAAATVESALARLQEEIGAAAKEVAAGLQRLAGAANRQLERIREHATALVEWISGEVRGLIHGRAEAARAAVAQADAKVRGALQGLRTKLEELPSDGFLLKGSMATLDIAAESAVKNRAAMALLPPATEDDRLSMMMAMPMDMDFAHLEGYQGEQIYGKVEKRWVAWIRPRRPLTAPTLGGLPVVPPIEVPWIRHDLPPRQKAPALAATPLLEVKVTELPGPFYYCWKRKGEGGDKELIWFSGEEFNLFQPYATQVKDTLRAAALHPWTVVPLYHYEPRRWSQATGSPARTEAFDGETRDVFPRAWDEPFERYFKDASKRPFMGIKMYTAMGYRPWDTKRLPNQAPFYARCEALEVPIVCHNSPAGFFTYDRPLYAAYEAKEKGWKLDTVWRTFVDDLKPHAQAPADFQARTGRGAEHDEGWEEHFFCEEFVSPRAWEKVLKQHPKLRLCLAHFGGYDAKEYTSWTREAGKHPLGYDWDVKAIDLAREFPNFYVDISFFFVTRCLARFRKALEDHPHLRDKIVFGTDWWMTEKDGVKYEEHVLQTRQALDGIDPELWPRFCFVNPARFFRVAKLGGAYAKAVEDSVAGLDKAVQRDALKAITEGRKRIDRLQPEAHHGG